jgi:hypothetical protein
MISGLAPDDDPTGSRMVSQWLAVREVVKQLTAAGHADLIDGRGCRWAWWKGDLYRHVATEACAGSCKGGADHGVFAWPLPLLPEPVVITARGEAA